MAGLAPLVAAGLSRLQQGLGRLPALAVTAFLFAEHLSSPLPLEPLPSSGSIPEVYRWLATRKDAAVVAELFWSLAPGFRGGFLGQPVQINGLGLRGEELARPKPARRKRVACFGDSITFGYGV
jgi:hypothetical protein